MDTGMAKRESQISNAFARLDKTIDELNGLVNMHGQSLMSVLRDEPEPAEQSLAEKKLQTQVAVANAVNTFSDRLQRIISTINSMQRRLEL